MKVIKKCRTCAKGRRLVCKIWYSVVALQGIYYCTAFCRLISPMHVCDAWERQIDKYDLSVRRLEEAMTDVRTIMEILNVSGH